MAMSMKDRNKSVPQLPPINSATSLNADNNLSKVLVITKNDLDRITGHLNKKQKEEDLVNEENQRRKELHEKSLALTRNWNNTIQGSRRHKLAQKAVRENKQEDKRRAVDLEHAQWMAEERKKALEKAKLLQYHETDRIKTFHSALKYSEVLKEREAQIEMKKLVEKLNKDREEEKEREVLAVLEEKAYKDALKDYKKQEDLDKLTEFHKKQIKEHMERIDRGREETQKEAEALQQLNDQYMYEKEQLESIRRKKVKDLKETYDQALETKKKMKEAEQIMDEEENDEIRVYANAKKKMAIIRRQKENEMQKEKEENREKMMALLGAMMKSEVAEEDFRIAKAKAKTEARVLAEEKFKEDKFNREMKEIREHRSEIMKRKQLEKLNREKEETEEMKRKVETDLAWQRFEMEKSKQVQEKLHTTAKQNLKLSKERRDQEKQIKFADRDFVLREMELMNMEDKQFEDYATKVIDYMEHHGRNVYPMKKVIGETLNVHVVTTNDKLSEAAAIKKHQQDVPTKKNLGFG